MSKASKIMEASLIAALSASLMILLLILNPRCRELEEIDEYDGKTLFVLWFSHVQLCISLRFCT